MEVNISKFILLALIYIVIPIIFTFWGVVRKKSWKLSLMESIICMMVMPLALTLFGNNDLSDFVSRVTWENKDTYIYMKLWAYSAIFSLGEMNIARKLYESMTGSSLDGVDNDTLDKEVEKRVEDLASSRDTFKITEIEANSLLEKIKSNNRIKIDTLSADENNIIKDLTKVNAARIEDNHFIINPVGRGLLIAKLSTKKL